MMTHLFLSYELSVLAKEKGFNEPCLYFISQRGVLDRPVTKETYTNSEGLRITAPLYQQVIEWLVREHKILIQESFDGWRALREENGKVRELVYTYTKEGAIKEVFKLI